MFKPSPEGCIEEIILVAKNILMNLTLYSTTIYGLKKAIIYAMKIEERLSKGWRPFNINFTIGDLYDLGKY
ncbi:hypothetical protein PV797_10825 [Clostridiaceae bacterium M8S5]|nr:hypothetical protein PV797_10825 [Clostridiaceae bacterium M8S5]